MHPQGSNQGDNQIGGQRKQLMTRSQNTGNGSFVGLVRFIRAVYWLSEKIVFHVARDKADQQAKHNEHMIRQGVTSDKLQNDALGTLEDARALGFTQAYCGTFLGFLEGVALFNPWDYHVNTCGLAGSGKSTTLAMPNIISLAMGDKPESCVIFDLKNAELSWATSEGRALLDGLEPRYISPWGLHGRKNTRINFFSDIADKAQRGEMIVDDALAKVRIIFGDPEKDGANAWIKKDAMRFATLLMIYWARFEPKKCKPSSFWDFATLPHDDVADQLENMRDADMGEKGYIYTVANKLYDQYGKEWSEQFEWAIEALLDGFSLFGKGSDLREATECTDFDIGLLKKRPQAVYIIIPDLYVDSHGKYIALLLDYIFSTLAQAKGTVRTTILADEFSNFPKVQSALKVLRLYRDKLIRLWTFVQDRNGFLQYQDLGGYQPFEENSLCLLWGITGQHAKDIQEKAGYYSVVIEGHSSNAGIGGDTGGLSGSEQLTPVLPVSKISQIVQGQAILDAREKIFVIDRLPWWEIDFLKGYIKNTRTDPPPEQAIKTPS